jgi:hypothetical protein
MAFTSPLNDPTLSNFLFNITGTINPGILTPPVTVTVQIFTNGGVGANVTLPQTTVGTNNWTVGVTNYLRSGSYVVEALAMDSFSNQTVISTNFNFIADTNPPMIVITSPANNAVVYHNNSQTLQGTAAGNGVVPVASVTVTMTPQAASDGTVPQGGFTNTLATGTTSWSLSLSNAFSGYIPPGTFQVVAQVTDESGTVAEQTNVLTISALQIIGNGTVALAVGSTNVRSPIGYPMQYGSVYKLTATSGAGSTFANWNYTNINGDYLVPNNPWTNFTYIGGLMTADFVVTNTAKGEGIAVTYPKYDTVLLTNSFVMKGTIAHEFGPAEVTVEIYSLSTASALVPPTTISGKSSWSLPVTNLPPDVYGAIVTATNSTGSSTLVYDVFETLEFWAVAGTYNGIFLCTSGPVTPTNSGFFTFTIVGSGAYEGRVLFPGYKPIPVLDALNLYGQGQHDLTIPGNNAHMFLALNVDGGLDEMTGTVASDSNSWTSQLFCYRGPAKLSSNTTPASGKYVLSLNPANWGGTNGYAVVNVGRGGGLTLVGALPDGATFSQSLQVYTNGTWPLYTIPTGYKTNGMLMGWVTSGPSNDISGQLNWYKAPGIGAYVTNGLNTNVIVTGTNFIVPDAGTYTIVFQGGSIVAPITNQLTVARAGGQFKPVDPTDKLAISLSSSGVLTGHLVLPGDDKPVKFQGIFLSQSQGGTGFVLDSGSQVGYFVLEPQ